MSADWFECVLTVYGMPMADWHMQTMGIRNAPPLLDLIHAMRSSGLTTTSTTTTTSVTTAKTQHQQHQQSQVGDPDRQAI